MTYTIYGISVVTLRFQVAQISNFLGLHQGHRWEELTALPRPPSWGLGRGSLPLPQEPHSPLSTLRASGFGPSTRSFVPLRVRDKISPPPPNKFRLTTSLAKILLAKLYRFLEFKLIMVDQFLRQSIVAVP